MTDDDLPEAAAEEARASGSWAKVIGDTPIPGPGLTRTFSAAALVEAAARVHAVGGRIAIHCAVPDVIHDAIEAGFDSLEHGSFLRLDQVQDVAARGIAWVPTCSIDGMIRGIARDAGWPEHDVRAIDQALDRQPEVLREAARAGVTVLAGTDAGMGPHGLIRHEVELMLAAGLDAQTALGAASWTARAWLGLPGIEEGAPADLVAFREDPRDDPRTLADPALILLEGQLIRDPR